MTKMTRKI